MMKKVLIGVGITAAVVVCLLCLGNWLLSGSDGAAYYAQIDNSQVEEGHGRKGVIDFQGGMPYSYTLTAYSERGKEKSITFGTSRELTDGAYIRLEVVPLRGVVSWQEAQYDELPAAVQAHYPQE